MIAVDVWALSLTAWLAAVLSGLAVYRLARRHSPLLSGIFLLGVLLRVVFGTALFFIPKLELPLLTSLQAGGGFWKLAIDAEWYFEHAARAATAGVHTISSSDPS